MAVTASNEQKAKVTIEAVRESGLDQSVKSDLEDLIFEAKENTNGRTQEEKIQSITETQFSMVRLLSNIIIQQNYVNKSGMIGGWKAVIVNSKWQITIICAILAVLLIFRPEIALVIQSCF